MAGNMKRALAVENTHIPAITRRAASTWTYVVPARVACIILLILLLHCYNRDDAVLSINIERGRK
jgi:hypothetical protein